MSTVAVGSNFTATSNVIGGLVSASMLRETSDRTLNIEIQEFGISLSFAVRFVEISQANQGVVFKADIDNDIELLITLVGEFSTGDGSFRIAGANWHFLRTKQTARTDFLINTIMPLLNLAEQVSIEIPEIEVSLDLKFPELPLNVLSDMLQLRLLAYRIMTIEKATGLEFQLPPNISGAEAEAVALIYKAITEGTFTFPMSTMRLPMPAIMAAAADLVRMNQGRSITFGPDPQEKMLFGKAVFLGEGTITLEDKIIEDFERVLSEMQVNDGHEVEVVIRSQSGRGQYNLPNAPRLPAELDAQIRQFAELDHQLSDKVADRYLRLTAATLDGLTEEEKEAVTARPELEIEAFVD